MARMNVARTNKLNAINAAGTPVRSIANEKQLTRLVLANMLFEDQFYVDGKTSAKAIAELVAKVSADFVSHLAIAARSNFKLRHVPLLLTRELARKRALTADTLNAVIQRPDEMGEFLAHYWSEGKTPLANQVKKGLALALNKFNEYQLAKWDKNSAAIRIRDVLFLTHAKPKDAAQAEVFQKLADDKLETPDTWETELSAGADKGETFTRLMLERKLGALAFLRNLRNMVQSGVDNQLIRSYARKVDVTKVLPFRYVAAARIVPQFEDMLEEMMLRSLESHEKIPGRTVLVVDVSGSMGQSISSKNDLNRLDAACALAMLAREVCEEVVIYATAGNDGMRVHATTLVAPRRGFALAEAIKSSTRVVGGGGIFLIQCMKHIQTAENGNQVDRVIVFTDEQDTGGRGFDPASAARLAPKGKNYILNVGAYQNGINSAEWETVSGFSEASLDYIMALEKSDV